MFYKMFPWEGLDPSPIALGDITYLQTLRCPPPPLPSQDKIVTLHSFWPVEQERPTFSSAPRLEIQSAESSVCFAEVVYSVQRRPLTLRRCTTHTQHVRRDVTTSQSAERRAPRNRLSHHISPSFLRNADFVTREVAPLNCNILSNNQLSIVVELR